jgi:hypothetical protein
MASSRTLAEASRTPIWDLPDSAARPGTRGGVAGFALIEPRWHGKNTATGSAGAVAGFSPIRGFAYLNVRRHDGRMTKARVTMDCKKFRPGDRRMLIEPGRKDLAS